MGWTRGVCATALIAATLSAAACSAPMHIMDPPPPVPPSAGGELQLDPKKVPDPAYVSPLLAAEAMCTGVDAPTLAAQIEAESNWDPRAVSPAGAQGISQFMPATWVAFGADHNNDGATDVFDPQDAIPSQGSYACQNYEAVAAAIADGTLAGDPVPLTLAAYNAGLGAVLEYRGIPPYSETQSYLARIMERRLHFAVAGSGGPPVDGYYPAGLTCVDRGDPMESGLQPTTIRGLRCVREQFTASSIASGWRARGSTPTSDHPAGLAIDITPGAPWDSAEGNRFGWQMAHWFQVNSARLGVKYILWDNYRWPGYDGRRGWVAYDHPSGRTDPSAAHRDHVHVSFNSTNPTPDAALVNHDPQLEKHPRGVFLTPEQALPAKERP